MTNLDGVFPRECGAAVAALARWSGDLTVVEDAVQEALTEALRAWPHDGPPQPWRVGKAVARNRVRDRLRQSAAGDTLRSPGPNRPVAAAHRCDRRSRSPNTAESYTAIYRYSS